MIFRCWRARARPWGKFSAERLKLKRQCLTGLRLVSKNSKTGREAVQVRRAADGTDFAVAKKSADGHGAELRSERANVVIRFSVEMFAAAQARKKQRAARRSGQRFALR